MKQLKLGDICVFMHQLDMEGMPLEEITNLPIYIGDDDELNGIHCAWYTNLVDADNTEDAYFVELINENRSNIKLEGKAIVIS